MNDAAKNLVLMAGYVLQFGEDKQRERLASEIRKSFKEISDGEEKNNQREHPRLSPRNKTNVITFPAQK